MATTNFKVDKITKGEFGFQVKVIEEIRTITDVFGTTTTYPRKFYRWMDETTLVENQVIQLDPDKYDQVKEPYPNPKTGEVIMLTYLKDKR